MRSKGTDIETLLMVLGGVIILILFLFAFSEWKAIKEPQLPKQIETGCANDDSKCVGDPKGKVCIKISETREKIEYACGCMETENCPSGKCKRETGSKYGFCE